LLKLISDYTGLSCVSLIAGAPPAEGARNYTIATVHYGVTRGPVPRDFAGFDPGAFSKDVLGTFAKFLANTQPCTSSIKLAILATDSTGEAGKETEITDQVNLHIVNTSKSKVPAEARRTRTKKRTGKVSNEEEELEGEVSGDEDEDEDEDEPWRGDEDEDKEGADNPINMDSDEEEEPLSARNNPRDALPDNNSKEVSSMRKSIGKQHITSACKCRAAHLHVAREPSTCPEPVLPEGASEDIRARLATLPMQERLAETLRLSLIDEFELMRENNIARLWALRRDLDLVTPITETPDPSPDRSDKSSTPLEHNVNSGRGKQINNVTLNRDDDDSHGEQSDLGNHGDNNKPSDCARNSAKVDATSNSTSKKRSNVSKNSEDISKANKGSDATDGGTSNASENSGRVSPPTTQQAPTNAASTLQSPTAAVSNSQKLLASIDRSTWPKWIVDHFQRFSMVSVESTNVSTWVQLLADWVIFEKEHEWSQAVRKPPSLTYLN
jgi:hypothetical protein